MRVFGESGILSVFDEAGHLYASSIRHLEVTADCLFCWAEKFARKLPIHHRNPRRILIVMQGEFPAGEQGSALGTKIARRDVVHVRIRCGIRCSQIRRSIGKDIRTVLVIQKQRVGKSDRLYARNRRDGVDHALLHRRDSIAGVTRHVQISTYQHSVLWLKTEMGVQCTGEPAHCNHRRGDQHCAQRNLHCEQDVSPSNMPPDPRRRPRLDDLIWTCTEYVGYRDCGKQESADHAQKERNSIHSRVRVYWRMHREIPKWLPFTQSAQ